MPSIYQPQVILCALGSDSPPHREVVHQLVPQVLPLVVAQPLAPQLVAVREQPARRSGDAGERSRLRGGRCVRSEWSEGALAQRRGAGAGCAIERDKRQRDPVALKDCCTERSLAAAQNK
jgi:hypothetical protein